MTYTDLPWKRLEKEFSSAMETLGALEAAAAHAQDAGDLERLRLARRQASDVAQLLRRGGPREVASDWKDWVSAETAWLEFRFEMHRLASVPGSLRQAFLASLAQQLVLVDQEVGTLQASSGRFRPSTRIAIAREVDRLRRRLETLRGEIRRFEASEAGSNEGAIRDIGDAWSDASWAVETTTKRFSRPRWRQGREASSLPQPGV